MFLPRCTTGSIKSDKILQGKKENIEGEDSRRGCKGSKETNRVPKRNETTMMSESSTQSDNTEKH